MGIIDKIMSILNLDGDDFDDDYDDYDDFDDDYDERPERKGIFKRRKTEEEEDDLEDSVSTRSKSQKVTPIRQASRKQGNGMEVCVIKPTSFEDSREVTETLLSNRTVVLNFEGLDVEIAQRIIDFVSGSCFAIGGNLKKVSGYIFLVTPKNVDISGDLQEILSGSIDLPSVYNKF